MSIVGTIALGKANEKAAPYMGALPLLGKAAQTVFPDGIPKDQKINPNFLRQYLRGSEIAASTGGMVAKIFAKIDDEIRSRRGGPIAVQIAAYTDYLQIGGALSTLFGIAFLVGARRRRAYGQSRS